MTTRICESCGKPESEHRDECGRWQPCVQSIMDTVAFHAAEEERTQCLSPEACGYASRGWCPRCEPASPSPASHTPGPANASRGLRVSR